MTIRNAKTVRPREATRSDLWPLAGLAAAATRHLSVVGWLLRRATDHDAIMLGVWAALIRHGIRHGHVDTVTDRSAVAVWLPTGHADAASLADRYLTARVRDGHLDRFDRHTPFPDGWATVDTSDDEPLVHNRCGRIATTPRPRSQRISSSPDNQVGGGLTGRPCELDGDRG